MGKEDSEAHSGKSDYKTSRKSFALNYALSAVLLVVLVVLSPGMDPKNPASLAIVAFILIFLSVLVSEPENAIQSNTYTVTDNEVVYTSGIFSKSQTIIPYSRIEGIRVDRSALGRLLGFGDIEVGSTKDSIVMRGLEEVDDVYRRISDRVNSKTIS